MKDKSGSAELRRVVQDLGASVHGATQHLERSVGQLEGRQQALELVTRDLKALLNTLGPDVQELRVIAIGNKGTIKEITADLASVNTTLINLKNVSERRTRNESREQDLADKVRENRSRSIWGVITKIIAAALIGLGGWLAAWFWPPQ